MWSTVVEDWTWSNSMESGSASEAVLIAAVQGWHMVSFGHVIARSVGFASNVLSSSTRSQMAVHESGTRRDGTNPFSVVELYYDT
jgi:hypothetical protein